MSYTATTSILLLPAHVQRTKYLYLSKRWLRFQEGGHFAPLSPALLWLYPSLPNLLLSSRPLISENFSPRRIDGNLVIRHCTDKTTSYCVHRRHNGVLIMAPSNNDGLASLHGRDYRQGALSTAAAKEARQRRQRRQRRQ